MLVKIVISNQKGLYCYNFFSAAVKGLTLLRPPSPALRSVREL